MAASGSTSRAINAGLSCGVVFAVPVAAYVATMPFPGANDTVTACALPFTVGALAGVGILSAVSAVGRHRAMADDDAESAPSEEFDSGDFVAEADFRMQEDTTRFFGSHKVPKDVPVIARAQDALSEEEAWADIDALLSEDSPISCDAEHSKDIYQIALEELQRETVAATQVAATTQTNVPAEKAVSAQEHVTMQEAAAIPTAAASATFTSGATAPGQLVEAAASTTQVSTDDLSDTDSAQQAALASLDEIDGTRIPQRTPLTRITSGEVAAAPRVTPEQQDKDATPHVASPQQESGAIPVRRTASQRTGVAVVASVEPVSFAGHEEMWAAALAILSGAEESESTLARSVYVPRHMRPAAASTDAASIDNASAADVTTVVASVLAASDATTNVATEGAVGLTTVTSPDDAARAAAIAEGRRANAMHAYVNSLIEEELDRVPSPSFRRVGHEYLRVIQGGTVSMPRLKAEA